MANNSFCTPLGNNEFFNEKYLPQTANWSKPMLWLSYYSTRRNEKHSANPNQRMKST
jgi:hypothetical protein